MNSADFIDSISSEWKQMDVVPGVSVEGARKKRRLVMLSLAGELLLAVIAFAAALFFWTLQLGLLFNLSGLVLFASGLHALIINHSIARPVIDWSDWSPQGLIEYQVKLCDSAVAKARYVVFSCCLLFVFAVSIWVVALIERDLVPENFEIIYATITLPVVIVLVLWASWRIRNKSWERIRYQRMKDAFVAADSSGD